MSTCFCVGPQPGETLCPCMLRRQRKMLALRPAEIALARQATADAEKRIRELENALAEIYAERGEDKFIADVCNKWLSRRWA